MAFLTTHIHLLATPNWLRRFWMLPKRESMTTLASDLILSAPPQEPVSDEQRQTQGLLLMLQRAVNALGAEGGIVQLWNPTLETLQCAVLLLADEQTNPPGSKTLDETLLAEVFYQQQAILRESDTRQLYLLRRRARGRTMLVAPLVAQGQTLGVLGIARRPRLLFARNDLALLERFAGQMALWLVYQQQARSTALLASLRADQEQKDAFIAEIAHELRTPLTVMKGRLQLLRRQLNKEGLTTAAEAVNTLDDPFNRLGQLISTLMDVSYIDAGRLELLRHVLDLSGLVRKVVERADTARPISLELAGQNGGDAGSVQPVLVVGDSARLELAIDCLLNNARKYSAEESQILVRLERRAEAGEVVISVQDFGIGISPEDQQRIFQRWFRATTSAARGFGGIGLSLYLSAQIISMHGGRIWVESSGIAGEGSTFFFSLPLVAPQEVGSLSDQAQGQTGNQES